MNLKTFTSHPIYSDYEASRDGIVRHKRLKKTIGTIINTGYILIRVCFNKKIKMYLSHRFIWECHNGLIPNGLVIDHINRDKLDNRLDNLRAVTPRENTLNSVLITGPRSCRSVIGVMDIHERVFPSTYSAGKYYDIHHSSIKSVADGITVSAYSKRFHCWVSFLYV